MFQLRSTFILNSYMLQKLFISIFILMVGATCSMAVSGTGTSSYDDNSSAQRLIEQAKTNPQLMEKAQEMMGTQGKTQTEGKQKVEKQLEEKQVGKIDTSFDTTGVPTGVPVNVSSVIEQMFSEQFPIGVSRAITQFGYDIFEVPTTFAPGEVISVPPDYVIGPDDELIINIWGKLQETFKVTVDNDGKIILPKVGAIYVWGLKFNELEPMIHKQLEQYYTSLQLSISMGKLRAIRVFVFGEVARPGAYTISALSTSFHALFAAGGPTKVGSMRNIKLISGKEEKLIDLYDILLYGSKKSVYFLNSGDIIYVPTIGRVAGIAGSVKRPGIYELKDERFDDFIKMVGDITPVGYLKRIQIERIEAHQRKVVIELELENENPKQFEVKDGDLILISPILPKRYNYVTIAGNVFRPGEYALKPNLRVRDLVMKAEGVRPGTYFERAEISRFRTDRAQEIIPIKLNAAMEGDSTQNILLCEWDMLTIYAEADIFPSEYVTIRGAVKKPNPYKLTPNMTIEDLIFRAGGYTFTADMEAAEFCRTLANQTPQTVRINLRDSTVLYKKLMHGDQLFIRQNVKWGELPKIELEGEVVHPGVYMINSGEKIASVIKRAGGLTDKAFPTGAIFTRKSVKEQGNKAIQDFVLTARKNLLQQSTSLETARLSQNEYKEQQDLIKHREAIVNLLATSETPGRIQIDLVSPKSLSFDVILEDGDSLFIPEIPSAVQIIGCVYNPSAIIYSEDKPINWYVSRVGGITPDGDKNNIYILKSSGRASKSGKIGRGDVIVVPERFAFRRPNGDVVKDVAQVLYQLGYSAIAMYTIYTLIPK